MRLIVTAVAALTLAGCQSPAPTTAANDTDSPNETVVEGQLENEQVGEAADIENDAANDSDNLDLDNDV